MASTGDYDALDYEPAEDVSKEAEDRANEVQLNVELLQLSDVEGASMDDEKEAASNPSYQGAEGLTEAPPEQDQTQSGDSVEPHLPVQVMLKMMEDMIKLNEEKTEPRSGGLKKI